MTDAGKNDGSARSTVSSKETCTHVGYIDGENMTMTQSNKMHHRYVIK